MSAPHPDQRVAVSTRTMEIIVSLLILAMGAVVIWDSKRLGSGWTSDGPQAGYFPFYIGLLLVISSVINLIRGLKAPVTKGFVEAGQAKLVFSVLVPLAIYVLLVNFLGLYVASFAFIAYFMIRLG